MFKKLVMLIAFFLFSHFAIAEMKLEEVIDYDCRFNRKACAAASEVKAAVKAASSKYGVDPLLLLSIVREESKFRPLARSSSSHGLAQVNSHYHLKKFEGKSIYDIAKNVDVGASILKYCIDRKKGNVSKALRCYNGYGDKRYDAKVLAFKRYLESNSFIL